MKILFSLHLYPPSHNCGAELFVHEIGKFLISKGHEVKVLAHYEHKQYNYQGIDVYTQKEKADLFAWCDVVFTHLDMTAVTIREAKKKPIVHFIHNDTLNAEVVKSKNSAIVYNSKWIKDKLNYKFPSMILNPPCLDKDNLNPKAKYITLINLYEKKGGSVLYKIAERMPERLFVGVLGGYGVQVIKKMDNVIIHEHTSDINIVYDETRIIIMPSIYESWGRVASEAMARGIPVICTPTPGLKENCKAAAIYCEMEDIDCWVKKIRMLDDKENYKKWSVKGIARHKEKNPQMQLNELEKFITKFVG